jgi:hypothetical protein
LARDALHRTIIVSAATEHFNDSDTLNTEVELQPCLSYTSLAKMQDDVKQEQVQVPRAGKLGRHQLAEHHADPYGLAQLLL